MRAQALDVVVADVPAVLAEVRGDAVRAGVEAHARGLDRIGIRRPARVAERGDVIDVDVQPHHEATVSASQAKRDVASSQPPTSLSRRLRAELAVFFGLRRLEDLAVRAVLADDDRLATDRCRGSRARRP